MTDTTLAAVPRWKAPGLKFTSLNRDYNWLCKHCSRAAIFSQSSNDPCLPEGVLQCPECHLCTSRWRLPFLIPVKYVWVCRDIRSPERGSNAPLDPCRGLRLVWISISLLAELKLNEMPRSCTITYFAHKWEIFQFLSYQALSSSHTRFLHDYMTSIDWLFLKGCWFQIGAAISKQRRVFIFYAWSLKA